MLGAVLGDMIGSRFEFDRSPKVKQFRLFDKRSEFTDDTVMTMAVAKALLSCDRDASEEELKEALITNMKEIGRRYPNAGYGGMFATWLFTDMTKPYNSFGNGSAMRVSAAGWLYETLERTREVACITAEVTHNHPEGIKGAECTAAAIWLARHGHTKAEIRDYITQEFGYDLSRTCDEIRPAYRHVETCQQTVPEAVTAFLEGEDFEDVIRTAVSLGGDCDTLTCIAGGIAEAYYGIPEAIADEGMKRLSEEFREILEEFRKAVK